MAKRMHKAVRWSLRTIGALLLLVIVVSLLLLYPPVQTWLARLLGDHLSSTTGITIRIERVEIRPFGPSRLHKVFVADLQGDTLIAADELWLRGVRIHTADHRIELRRLELHDTRFALSRDPDDPYSNLTHVLKELAAGDTTSSGEAWRVACRDVDIERLHFTYADGHTMPLPFGVDFHHLDVNTADVIGHDLRVAGDSVRLFVDKISVRERRSGFDLQELSGDTKVSPRGIRIAGMHIRTPGTELRGDLRFNTTSFGDYDDFETNVRMRVDLDSSRVEFADVALFATDLRGIHYQLGISGKFRGTVSELKGRHLDLRFGRQSHFAGDAELTGLPDVPNTFMVVDVSHLNTDPIDLQGLPVPPFLEGGHLELPPEVERMGDMGFTGNFTGFINSFTAYGSTSTEAGGLRTDIAYERDTVSHVFQLSGRLATEGFDLGRVFDDPSLGPLACDVKVKARGHSLATLDAELEGTVPRLTAAGASVGGIAINGRLERNLFNGTLHCDDPNAMLDFKGLADLRGRWPKVDFTAQVEKLDLRALGVLGGQGYSAISMGVTARGELAPDSLKGSIDLTDVSYCEDSLDLEIGNVSVSTAREAGEPVMDLRSDVVDLNVRGPFYPTRLPQALKSVVYSVFPALQSQVRYTQEEQRFAFTATIKHAQPVLNVVLPGLELDSNTTFSGSFDSRTFDLGLSAHLPRVRFGALSGDSVEVILDKTLDVLAFRFRSTRQAVRSGTFISGIEITGKAYQDEVQLRAGWEGSNNGTSGDLNIDALVKNDHALSADVRPSKLYFGRGEWVNDRTAHIEIDSSSIRIDSLALHNEGQRVMLNGTISEDPTAKLDFDLQDLQLDNVRPFYEGPEVRGAISGDGSAFRLYDHPYLLSYLCVDSLTLASRPVGDLRFAATWNNQENAVDLSGELQRDTIRMLSFAGKLSPGREQELDVDLLLDRLDLRFIEPYLPSAISDVQGRVTGKVDITGKLSDPQANGEIMLDDAGVRINYLNTKYTFSHKVIIRPDQFAMDFVTLYDGLGGSATADAFTINHHGFTRWNFDVAAQLNSLLVLNTTLKENSLYYGRAVGSGELNVDGYTDNLGITVDAQTMEGTFIHFPLGASVEVGGLPYVRFVAPGQNPDSLQAPVDLSGVHLDMKVAVTPEARFELIFDPTVGDIMSGSGRGDIRMTVTPTGDFSMKGGVEITEGDYLFTLRNLVNKKFTVDPGGRIAWFGDPFDAQIDIDAVYSLKTSLYDIIPQSDRSEAYRKRVPVDVLMHLSDKLMNPDIDFEIRLPRVDEGTRTQVQAILSDKDRLNNQVFGLIALGKFLPDVNSTVSGGFGQDAATSAATTLSEFASSQLSNFANKLSPGFDLGLNYRPANSIAKEEWDLAFNKGFFNGRVLVSTNLGVTSTNTTSAQSTSQFIGDFSGEYLISPDGHLRLKAYSQSNDRNLNQLNQAPTTQGIGLAYSREFDTIGIWQRFLDLFRGKSKATPEAGRRSQ